MKTGTPHPHDPKTRKSDDVIKSGYSPDDFGESYWLEAKKGRVRIERDGNQIIEMVRRLVKMKMLPDKPRVVDIGAGAGNYVKDIRAAGFHCDGCEFSKSGRDLALARFGIKLYECDLRHRIDMQSGQYDYGFCTGVFSMIPNDFLENAMNEIHRILRPRGLLMVNLLNPKSVSNEPHLTSMHHREWRRLICGRSSHLFDDVTSICQPGKFGTGLGVEFCGLFEKLSEPG